MKKYIKVFMAILMVFCLTACGAAENTTSSEDNGTSSESINNNVNDNDKITVDKVRNAPETSADDFETEEVDGGISIDKYIGDDEIVVIPEEIDGMPVTSIGSNAFVNNKQIKAVKISDSVIDIETNAFLNCSNLEIFISGKNVERIGDYALSYCKSLKFLELNDGIKTLGLSCLVATHSLNELYMPTSLIDINFPFLKAETNVTIIAEAGSAAETYAKENGIKYKIR